MRTIGGSLGEGMQFERARDAYETRVNPILLGAGIDSHREFIDALQCYLRGIPELALLAATAATHDCRAVLSAGSARAILISFLRDLATKPADVVAKDVKPSRALFEMLEGSDVDVLLIGPEGAKLPTSTLDAIRDNLNFISGSKLLEPLPSVQRRLYAAEWDVVDAASFLVLNRAFGGDTVSLIGLGLDADGDLVVYDPARALFDFFHGEFNYIFGKHPYDHEMVVKGKFDPSLDGLRIVRMAGQLRDVHVELGAEGEQALRRLGREANRREWEVAARFEHSPEGKLRRRWAKYTHKIFVDHTDPLYARTLLEKSGYLSILSHLGLRHCTLAPLPAQRPVPSSASPEAQSTAAHTHASFAWIDVDSVRAAGACYRWQPSRLAALSTGEPPRHFMQEVSEHGPGLLLSEDTVPEGALASKLVRYEIGAQARVLDLRSSSSGASLLSAFVAAEQSKHAHLPERMMAGVRSSAAHDLLVALGADAVLTDAGMVVRNASALAHAHLEKDIEDGVLSDLEEQTPGTSVEHRVRALIATRGEKGLRELARLLYEGKVTLAELFPSGGPVGGLFADVPYVSLELAEALELQLSKCAGRIAADQQSSVLAAIELVQGTLPHRYGAVPPGGHRDIRAAASTSAVERNKADAAAPGDTHGA